MSMPKRVLIRCDGGSRVGLGHFVRCLALADELQASQHYQISFAVLEGIDAFKEISHGRFNAHYLSPSRISCSEREWIEELIVQYNYQAVILDVRTVLSGDDVCKIREGGTLVVAIDDISSRSISADMAFLPPIPQVKRLPWSKAKGKQFIGWDWVVLREEFANANSHDRAPREESLIKRKSRLTVLVTMGGSDPAELTLVALQAIDQIAGNFRVLVVVGKSFSAKERLEALVSRSCKKYTVIHNAQDMSVLMAQSDLAVASFGMTAYELSAMQVPSIYMCMTSDHAESCSSFVESGIARSLGTINEITVDSTRRLIEELLYNDKLRLQMSKMCQGIVDGRGVSRICTAIADELN